MNTFLDKLNQYKSIYHTIFWMSLWIFIFRTIDGEVDSRNLILSRIKNQSLFALVLTTSLLMPIMIYTYLNIYLFDTLFSERNYLAYFIALVVTGLIIATSMHFVLKYVLGSEISFMQNLLNLLVSTLMIVGVRFMKNGLSKQYQLQEAKAKQIETELNLLKSQINPHFLFNTLNNIYATNLSQQETANDMILQLSDLMRYQLESSKKEVVSLQAEIDMIENYIALERKRLTNSSQVTFQIQGDFTAHLIAPMLLIPFVENCFKHGVGIEKTQIEIYAYLKDKEFTFITKNHIPLTKATQVISTKTGIQNLERRLDILYPKKHKLIMDVEADLFVVRLKMDL